jgi:hypothetical protein
MTKPNSALQAGGDETPVAIRELIEDLCSAAVSYGERDTKDAENAYYAAKAKLIGATRPTPAAAAGMSTSVGKPLQTSPADEQKPTSVGVASPVAPAGVPIDALHQRIMNLPLGPLTQFSEDERVAYLAGHRDARHAAAELVCAVLSAGAPAVPLQDEQDSSVHQAAPGSSPALRAASKDALRPVAEAA